MAICGSPTARRTCSKPRKASMWRRRRSKRNSKASARTSGELLVIGEAKPYCVALVSLDNEAITDWAGKQGLAGNSFAEIASDEKTRELIAGYIDALNSGIESLGADQEIRDHRPRALDRSRRPDAEHEAASQGRHREVRRPPLGSLRTMKQRRRPGQNHLPLAPSVEPDRWSRRDLRPASGANDSRGRTFRPSYGREQHAQATTQQQRGMACDQNACSGW